MGPDFLGQESSYEVRSNERTFSLPDDDTFVDGRNSHYFKFLMKKYKRHIGEMDGNSVCSGGLQQFLIKQQERKKRTEQNEDSQQQSKFECLPIDVRLHIFAYLTANELCVVSRVCRSWYDITEDNLLWSELLTRDVHKWTTMGHNTNPAMYKEVSSEMSNKEIYLSCSPEVKTLQRQQNDVFSNISTILRYFLPKKTPLFAMFGPGLETKTSGLVRRIISESDFEQIGMFPGKFDGVGGGFTLRDPAGCQFNLSVMYSATQRDRESSNRDRDHTNRLMKENKGSTDINKFELVPAVQDFCKTVDGFIYVVDASADFPVVEIGLNELQAMVSERWSATHVPVLILSAVQTQETSRVSCFEVVERLQLSQLNRPWQVQNCDIESRDGILTGLTWLEAQSRRKYHL